MWILPILVVGLAVALSIPLGRYMARVLDRGGPRNAFERLIDTGPQTWKQYSLAMLASNAVVFVFGYAVLATQPWHPAFLNPDAKGMLSPSTIFNTACSFLTNTNLQHYSGEVHLTYASQVFAILYKQMLTPAIGLAALLAVIRGPRGDKDMGNYNLDVWRGLIYVALPLSLILGAVLIACGVPMTLDGNAKVSTVEGTEQVIARGPVAAVVAIKQLGTNGGGFFGPNSAHPFENPGAVSNMLECIAIVLIPMACVVLFGRMLRNPRHAAVIFGVMLVFLLGLMAWGIATDTMRPNPGVTARPAVEAAPGKPYRIQTTDTDGKPEVKDLSVPALVGLPVDQTTGNLEGKELRFGTSAGPTWAAVTTCTSNGSVNCMHDSLNPLAGITPLTGMWLNCNFGGIGVGLINMLIYLVLAVFLAGLMVGREGNKIVGLVVLEDILKPGIKERFERLRKMGIRTVMVTGDNPLTAKAIAEQAGVDDYIAEATPEAKLAYIRKEQAGGRLVAMMGDGTNDAPALAQADVGVAMNSGTQAAKEAGNMVDLDSDPTKLIEVVEVGKQLLMTRGALTTFSIANDVAKYFAIVPALFAGTLPWLKALDFMRLGSPTSAILSAVIFNAVIIPCLIPIALKGVTYRPVGADALLRRNLLIWGLGGVILPFIGIKLIDLILVALGAA